MASRHDHRLQNDIVERQVSRRQKLVEQCLGLDDADDVVHRPIPDDEARMPGILDLGDELLGRRRAVQPGDLGPRAS